MYKIIDAKKTKNEDIIKRILKYKNVNYKIALAKNPNIKSKVMLELLNLNNSSITVALASNNHITSDVAEKLYSTGDFYTLESLSKNESCPGFILDKLKINDSFFIFLAENKSTPTSTLEYILNAKKDEDYCYEYLIDAVNKRDDVKQVIVTRKLNY